MTPTTRRGLLLAAGIVLGWVGSWLWLLPTSLSQLPPALVAMVVLVRTVLQTGLFIVAHDAMHGSLWPGKPEANRRVGQLMLALYASLPYRICTQNHALHHRHAGHPLDPDHHMEGEQLFWRWYGKFMASYLSPGQLISLVSGWGLWMVLAAAVSPTPIQNVLLFGVLPLLLSSLQLFVVGTFLPHRSALGLHRARSLHWPEWASLLACFHFGYHFEHHAFPDVPWHGLPAVRRSIGNGQADSSFVAFDLWGR